jgi:enoyl-CoA hydratase/carnithine racemase
MSEAVSGLEELDADEAVRVIALRGANGTFVSGAELHRLSGSSSTDFAGEASWLAKVESTEKPVVAVLEGWCLGGGALLALAADLRIGTTGLRFGIPAVRLGLAYPLDAVAALVRVAGQGIASQLLLSGTPIDGQRAYEVGLLNWVFGEEDFDSRVSEVLLNLAENAPLAMKAIKLAVAAVRREGGSSKAAEAADACWASADFVEGQLAVSQKRAPRFTGS